jgi:hypothetical protein
VIQCLVVWYICPRLEKHPRDDLIPSYSGLALEESVIGILGCAVVLQSVIASMMRRIS